MRILLLMLLMIAGIYASAQPVVNGTTGSNTINHPRLIVGKNLFVPRYVDTIAANIDKGIDTCGAIIYLYNDNSYWMRVCGTPKHWERLLKNKDGQNLATASLTATLDFSHNWHMKQWVVDSIRKFRMHSEFPYTDGGSTSSAFRGGQYWKLDINTGSQFADFLTMRVVGRKLDGTDTSQVRIQMNPTDFQLASYKYETGDVLNQSFLHLSAPVAEIISLSTSMGTSKVQANKGQLNLFASDSITLEGLPITSEADTLFGLIHSTGTGILAGHKLYKLAKLPASSLTAVVNLGYNPSPTLGTITNTAGAGANIPLADVTNAGLLSPADKIKLNTDYFFVNGLSGILNAGDSLVTHPDDTTFLFKQVVLNAGTNTTISRSHTSEKLNYTIGMSTPTLQQVLNAGSTLNTFNVIDGGTSMQSITSTSTSGTLNTVNTGTGKALIVSSASNTAVDAFATSGMAINATTSGSNPSINTSSTNGTGITTASANSFGVNATSTNAEAISATINNSNANGIRPILRLTRTTSGTATNGIAGSLEFWTKMSTGTIDTSGQLYAGWSNATTGSQSTFWGLTVKNNGGPLSRALYISSTKQFTLDGYGNSSAFISGDTTNKPAAFDASGNLVRMTGWASGTGTSNYVKKDTLFIGNVYSANTWVNLNYFPVNTVTATVVSNKISIPGGATNFSQSLELGDTTCTSHGNLGIGFTVPANGASNYGPSLGFSSINGYQKYGLDVFLNTSTDANRGKMEFFNQYNGGSWTTVWRMSRALSMTASDRVVLSFERANNTITFRATNTTTGTFVDTTFILGLNTSIIMSNTARPAIYCHGGAFTIDSIGWYKREIKRPRLLIVGDSKVWGYGASNFFLTWPALLGVHYHNIAISGGFADRTNEVINRLTEIIAQKPDYVLLAIGSNDLRSGASEATFETNYNTIVSTLNAAGIGVIHMGAMYESGGVALTTQNTFLATKSPFIDVFWDTHQANSNYTDGVHLSNLGDSIVYSRVLASNLLPDPTNEFEFLNASSGGGGSDGNNYSTAFGYNASTRTLSLSRSGLTDITQVLPLATTTTPGLMNSLDKARLDSTTFVKNGGGTLDSLAVGTGDTLKIKRIAVIGTSPITVGRTVSADSLQYNLSLSTTLTSGTYTPTLTGIANVSSSTPRLCMYQQIGDIVSVTGTIDIAPTASSTTTTIEITVPVATAGMATYELSGSATSNNTVSVPGMYITPSGSKASLTFTSVGTTSKSYFIHFAYKVSPP